MKNMIYITVFCLGIWGLLAGFFPGIKVEIFLGFLLPWFSLMVEIPLIKKTFISNPVSLTKLLIKGFMIKFVAYGVYLFVIIEFYTSNPHPFIFSFAGSFLVLHMVEAGVLKSITQT
ncbi:MAG: hypothetical protein ACE5D2_03615 [Fidelibacterota bacterium]